MFFTQIFCIIPAKYKFNFRKKKKNITILEKKEVKTMYAKTYMGRSFGPLYGSVFK